MVLQELNSTEEATRVTRRVSFISFLDTENQQVCKPIL